MLRLAVMARMKTKERILQVSLALFNDHGEPSITTLDISTELDISPGNLYYHYKGKDAIVAVLFEQFEAELRELQDIDEAESLLDVLVYLQLNFEAMARYLFLFRDLNDVLSRYHGLHKRFRGLLSRIRRALKALCVSLAGQGVLLADEQAIDRLLEHMLLTMCYGLAYQQVQAVKLDDFDADLELCAYQTVNLLAPFLGEEDRQALQEMSALYL